MRRLPACLALICLMGVLTLAAAATPIKSGIAVNQLMLPFTSNVVVGPYRGMQHCFVCDAGPNQVGLVLFARPVTKVTAEIVKGCVQTATTATGGNLISWLVFLGPRGTAAEETLAHTVEAFATENAMTTMNITVLGEPNGPPGYRISPDATLTLLIFRSNKVLLNGGWTPAEETVDNVTNQFNEAIGQMH